MRPISISATCQSPSTTKTPFAALYLKPLPFHPLLIKPIIQYPPIHTIKGLDFSKSNSDYAIIAPKRPSQVASSHPYSPKVK
ncbi:hypothetical protein EYC80_006605 [Monilinia laxa]|uniref:Uncharacterized protein n=1 Tax=Monilinia laxa TaxID=61186 RepID=A0A5N6JV50_MONLA|nr:hypothetical protein EYC80_006605 [Monilinia laxa]